MFDYKLTYVPKKGRFKARDGSKIAPMCSMRQTIFFFSSHITLASQIS